MKNILVIGASGFIGRAVVDELRMSHNVIAASNNAIKGYDDVDIDLMDRKSLQNVLISAKPDFIVNCAGIVENSEKADLNYQFTRNLLTAIMEANIRPEAVIIMGSASEYGEVSDDLLPVKEDAPLKAESLYGKSKIKETNYALSFAQKNNLNVIVARLFNPIGTGMHSRFLIPKIISQIQLFDADKGGEIEVNRLDAERDYIDVRDVAAAIRAIIDGKPSYDVYNIGSGVATSNGDLLVLIINKCANGIIVKVKETSQIREPQFASCADISRIEDDLGWYPTYTIEEAIKGIVNERE